MNPILSGHVLVFKDNKVLLVRHLEDAGHLTGVYGIPGGRINDGETLQETAAREFSEETGIKISKEDLKSFPNNEYTADIKRKSGEVKTYKMKVFVGENFLGEPKESEETMPEWVSVNKLSEYNLLPNVEKAIKNCLGFLGEKGNKIS